MVAVLEIEPEFGRDGRDWLIGLAEDAGGIDSGSRK